MMGFQYRYEQIQNDFCNDKITDIINEIYNIDDIPEVCLLTSSYNLNNIYIKICREQSDSNRHAKESTVTTI